MANSRGDSNSPTQQRDDDRSPSRDDRVRGRMVEDSSELTSDDEHEEAEDSDEADDEGEGRF